LLYIFIFIYAYIYIYICVNIYTYVYIGMNFEGLNIEGGSTTANQISILSGGAVTMLQGGVKGVIVRDAKRDVPGMYHVYGFVYIYMYV
jgi:hypothetical protein